MLLALIVIRAQPGTEGREIPHLQSSLGMFLLLSPCFSCSCVLIAESVEVAKTSACCPTNSVFSSFKPSLNNPLLHDSFPSPSSMTLLLSPSSKILLHAVFYSAELKELFIFSLVSVFLVIPIGLLFPQLSHPLQSGHDNKGR